MLCVNLTYFKDTGKYYSDSWYFSQFTDLGDIWNEVRQMWHNGPLPGLSGTKCEFLVLVDVPDHEHNHPRLIIEKESDEDTNGSSDSIPDR